MVLLHDLRIGLMFVSFVAELHIDVHELVGSMRFLIDS